VRKLLPIIVAASWIAGGASVATAVIVDFDSHIYEAEGFLKDAFPLRGQDNDGNGILEEDQLGMLKAILAGGAPVACLDSGRVSAILNAFNQNKSRANSELTVSASGVTIDIIDELRAMDPALATAVEELLGGYLTFADNSTLVFINNLADTMVAEYLEGTQQEGQIGNIQGQINFTAAEYFTYGNAASEPDYLGPAGDIDVDTTTNLAEYTAAGNNREAWLTSNCITPPLRLDELIGGGVLLSGASHRFFASAAGGTGNYTFQWRKGTTTSSTLLASVDEYIVPFLNSSTEGTYFCVVGDGQSSFTTPLLDLNVVDFPLTISRQIQGGTRTAGSSFTFTVEVVGGTPGPYVFTWRRGTTIVGGNASTLALTNLTTADAGQYTVSVTSNGGPDTKSSGPVTLNVTTPALSIAQHPQGATRTVGESHTFTVAATGGSGSYNYDWQKGGVTLGAPNQPTLELTNLQTSNSGNYRVVVSDAANAQVKVNSNVAVLTVVLPTLEITEQPLGAVKNLDESHTFTVAAAGGSGSFTYDWQKGGVSLGAASSPSLTLTNLGAADAGFYRVVVADATLPAATVTSNTAELVISYPPIVINVQPQGATKNLGESHTFTIGVSGGLGTYVYDWRKDGDSLGAPSEPSLTINSIQATDSGQYSCLVLDSIDPGIQVLSANAGLTVVLPPLLITQQPQGAIKETGESHTFTVEATGGSGTYHYEWRKDGALLGGAPDGPSLSLTNLQEEDSGAYTVVVIDASQSSNRKTSDVADLLVGEAGLVVTQQPQDVTTYLGGSAEFTVVVTGGSGNYGYNWRKEGATLSAPSLPTYSVASVTQPSAGNYDVVIIDLQNTQLSVTSEIAVLTTGSPLEIIQGPQDVLAELGAEATFSVVVQGGIGTLRYVWLFNGLPVLTAPDAPQWTITGLTAENIGTYAVRVSDDLDTEESQAATLSLAVSAYHDADTNQDYIITLSELLRVIQFFNTFGIHCEPGTEDGFGPGPGATECRPHTSDYAPQNWEIGLSELLRLIQFFNLFDGAYYPDSESEDGFMPGTAPGKALGIGAK
jgi:hypothetical protein